jgi:hypothetical protein
MKDKQKETMTVGVGIFTEMSSVQIYFSNPLAGDAR